MTVTAPPPGPGTPTVASPSGTAPPPAEAAEELFAFDTADAVELGGNQTAGPRRIRYEPALDGLRGAAVLAVVLYHAEILLPGPLRSLPLLSSLAADQPLVLGGFLGVDAFFVLSGYLITRLLLAEWSTTSAISLRTFWSHRARRLLPPLFVGLALVVVYAAVFAGPDQLEQIRWDGLSTLTYVANWRFISTGQSYFQMFAFRSPLQHMWSLAIEEQWYLIWPLVVLGLLRWQAHRRSGRIAATGGDGPAGPPDAGADQGTRPDEDVTGAVGPATTTPSTTTPSTTTPNTTTPGTTSTVPSEPADAADPGAVDEAADAGESDQTDPGSTATGPPRVVGARAVFWLSVVLGATSVLWMALQFSPGSDPSPVYFGTHTRAQSLLVGAALAAAVAGGFRLRRERSRRVAGWIGVGIGVLVLLAWLRTPDSAEWIYNLRLPLLPIGGFLLLSLAVAFVIFAATQHGEHPNPTARVLSVAPLRGLGLISYGVYVYHWPLFLIFNHEHTGLTGTWLFLVRIAVTLGLATASYRYLERPIRQGALGARLRFGAWLLPATAVLLTLALLVSTRGASATLAFSREKDATQRPPPSLDAAKAASGDLSRVLWVGDSVAYTLGAGIEGTVAEENNLAFWNQAVLYCELVEGARREKGKEVSASDTCRDWRTTWRADLDQFQPDVAVLQVGAWEIYDRKIGDEWLAFGSPEYDRVLRPTLREAINVLSSSGAPVVVLTTPRFERSDGASPVEWTVNDTTRTDHLNELLREAVAESGGRAQIVDLGGWLCPDGRCKESDGDIKLRRDGLHFTEEGAPIVARWLAPQIRQIALQGGSR